MPPICKKIKIKYLNGDFISVEFFELNTLAEARKRYPDARVENWPVDFPITAVEVANVVANTNLEFNAKETHFGTGNVMKSCFFSHCSVGLSIT